ncbi:MAG TPA: LysR family transcriptional regulator [Chthoniobacterales bacterium]|nr:LysR family transcriptional regulator [Chthoniobacterales bacterium]
MNIHHLELFYHVAKHGGIGQAVRKMPYGIQQPAVSAQVLRLEEHLGLKLFQRRPFVLTPSGRELFEFIDPFFSKVLETGAHLRGETSQRLRLAAPGAILRDHLPKLLEQYRRAFPQLRLSLSDANQATAENMLRTQEVDLAITEMEGRPASGIRSCALLRLPLQLLVSPARRLRSAQELWKAEKIADPLICMPSSETITKLFRARLHKVSVNWPTSVEVSSLDLIPSYVRAGFGIGLSVAAPGVEPPPNVRLVPLPNFPPLIIAALWQGKLPPIAEGFLETIKTHARTLHSKSKVGVFVGCGVER